MTREILNKIAKEHKINLSYYDHIDGYIDYKGTWLYITFANLECCGGHRFFYNQKTIKKSVTILWKNAAYNDGPDPYELTTQGWTWIDEIR